MFSQRFGGGNGCVVLWGAGQSSVCLEFWREDTAVDDTAMDVESVADVEDLRRGVGGCSVYGV